MVSQIDLNQKYNVDVKPISGGPFEITINVETEGDQALYPVYSKVIEKIEETFIHKLASDSGTYEICIENLNTQQDLVYEINFKTGLELMDVHFLPDNTDAQNLKEELKWLEG